MDFLVVTDGAEFMIMKDPRPRIDFETKQPVTRDGVEVMQVVLLVLRGGDAIQAKVSVNGDPGVRQGQFVRPIGLATNQVDRDGRESVKWWSVERLEPVTGEAAPEASAGRSRKAAE